MFLVIANFLAASAACQRAAATRKSTNIRSYLLRPTNAAKAAFVRGEACGKAPPTPPPSGTCRGFAFAPRGERRELTDKLQFKHFAIGYMWHQPEVPPAKESGGWGNEYPEASSCVSGCLGPRQNHRRLAAPPPPYFRDSANLAPFPPPHSREIS